MPESSRSLLALRLATFLGSVLVCSATLAGCAGDTSLFESTDLELHFSLCQCGSMLFGGDVEEPSWADCKANSAAQIEQALAALREGDTVSFSVPSGLDQSLRFAWAIDPNGTDEYAYPTFDENGAYIGDAIDRVDINLSRIETGVANCDGQNELVSTLVVSWDEKTNRVPF